MNRLHERNSFKLCTITIFIKTLLKVFARNTTLFAMFFPALKYPVFQSFNHYLPSCNFSKRNYKSTFQSCPKSTLTYFEQTELYANKIYQPLYSWLNPHFPQ